MDDILRFLLIGGVILVGIIREVNKNKAKKVVDKHPSHPSTHPQPEVAPDAMPLPEAWGKMFQSGDIFQPQPLETLKRKVDMLKNAPKKEQKKPKKMEISIESSLANSVAQDKLNSKGGGFYDMPSQLADGEEGDYSIRSAEDARRAIIWGEILQRKY